MAWSSEGRRSRRLAEYTDQLVLRHRHDGGQPVPPEEEDAELAALSRLAAELADVDVTPPPQFVDDLAGQLRQLRAAESEAAPRRWWSSVADRLSRAVGAWQFTPGSAPATLAVAVLAAVVAFSFLGQSPVVSAAEVLARSDEALTATVRPGEVLRRTWRVRVTSWASPDAAPVVRERVLDEWMDGADFDHVAAKSLASDGQRRAWTSRREHGQIHTVGYVGLDPRTGRPAELNIEPTRADYLRAADTFPPEARRLLHTYLDRWFIYMAMAGERRFNREILEGTFAGAMPRSVTVEHTTMDGRPAYAVRAVDPSRVVFRWENGRPPFVQLTRDDTVSYVAKDSYLTIKSERHTEYPTGRRTYEVRTLEDMRTYRFEELTDDPFAMDVPPGTPVYQQSAQELLTGVLAVLQPGRSDATTAHGR